MTLSTRGFGQEYAFGVSSIRLILWGSYLPKAPHFGEVNGDSQLERLRAYLGEAETCYNA
jgi:hypothetical protein